MVPSLIIFIFILSFVLIKSVDQVVIAVRRLSKNSSSIAFIISALFLAVATSLPEFFVAVSSALEGTPALSLGNVLGANIANLSLVAGLAAFVVGKVNVHGNFIKKEVAVAAIAGFLPLVLVSDRNLSRSDGLILLASYGAYASSFFKQRFLEIAESHRKEGFVHRFFRKIAHIDADKTKEAGRLFVGIALLLLSSNLLVKVAKLLAETANIPVFLVGLILLSIGTTLPELAFSIRSLEDREPTMFFGNLLGSLIANSTLIVGIAATITPIKVAAVDEYFIASFAFLFIFLAFWYFIKSKLALERWEAGVLLLVYIIFVVVEFWK